MKFNDLEIKGLLAYLRRQRALSTLRFVSTYRSQLERLPKDEPSVRVQNWRTPPPSTQTALLWWIAGEVRRGFSLQGPILLLLSHLLSKSD